jgi:uncharacterized protein YdeI (BOF family)
MSGKRGTFTGTSGNFQAFEDASFAVGDSPVVLNVHLALGYNARDGYIANDGSGDIQVEVAKDTVYSDPFTIKSGEVVYLEGADIALIRITHLGTDSSYRVVTL